MSCPYINERKINDIGEKEGGLTYSTYLRVKDLLSCVNLRTNVHDEHLFIVTHQVYELWFKQIIFEIDSVRDLFAPPRIEENDMLKANARLARITKILTILVEQMKILETMTPLDFFKFRSELGSASGFQSWQFRLLENKFGVQNAQRIKYSQQKYTHILDEEFRGRVEESEKEPSLFHFIESWLERTPCLKTEKFDFWKEFNDTCLQWFSEEMDLAKQEVNPVKREVLIEECIRRENTFECIFKQEVYESTIATGENSLSWGALKGALMIYFFRDEVQFHEAFQTLSLLMDIDSLINKWRFAHVLLVHRQIGTKMGTGSSSGYLYLRSTVSDRYRPFRDLFQLSNYLIPSKYIKQLKHAA